MRTPYAQLHCFGHRGIYIHASCTPQEKLHSVLDWEEKIQKRRRSLEDCQSLEEYKYYKLASHMLKTT